MGTTRVPAPLTIDLGEPSVGFHVAKTSVGQSFANNVVTQCDYDTVNFDYGGNISTSNVFTAPVKGIYYFHASILWTNYTANAGERADLRIYKNSSLMSELAEITIKDDADNFSAFMMQFVNGILDLDAGNTIEVKAWQSTGVTQYTYPSSYYNSFMGFCIRQQV